MSDTQFDRMVATGEDIVMLDADNDNDEEYIHHASSSSGTSHPVTVTNSSNGSNSSKGEHGSKKQASSSKASKEQAFARANVASTASDNSRQMSAPQPVQHQHTAGSIGKLSCTVTFTNMLLVLISTIVFVSCVYSKHDVAVVSAASINYSKHNCKWRLLAVDARRHLTQKIDRI
jgi:hypothetical protein